MNHSIILHSETIIHGKVIAREHDVTGTDGFKKLLEFLSSIPIPDPNQICELISEWEVIWNNIFYQKWPLDPDWHQIGHGVDRVKAYYTRSARLELRKNETA